MSDSKFTTHGDEPVEARIVAWVLGEASAFEAEELERLCEERPELAVFKRRIEAVHGLAKEAHDHKEDARWKLSLSKRSAINELIGAEEEAAEDLARDVRAGRSGRRAMMAIAACLVMTLVVATLTWPVVFSRKDGDVLVASDSAQSEQFLWEVLSAIKSNADSVVDEKLIEGERFSLQVNSSVEEKLSARSPKQSISAAADNSSILDPQAVSPNRKLGEEAPDEIGMATIQPSSAEVMTKQEVVFRNNLSGGEELDEMDDRLGGAKLRQFNRNSVSGVDTAKVKVDSASADLDDRDGRYTKKSYNWTNDFDSIAANGPVQYGKSTAAANALEPLAAGGGGASNDMAPVPAPASDFGSASPASWSDRGRETTGGVDGLTGLDEPAIRRELRLGRIGSNMNRDLGAKLTPYLANQLAADSAENSKGLAQVDSSSDEFVWRQSDANVSLSDAEAEITPDESKRMLRQRALVESSEIDLASRIKQLAKSDYMRSAYDHTRSEALTQVELASEIAVPEEGDLKKMLVEELDEDQLRDAVRQQENKVEERRKALAQIVRTKENIFRGNEAFFNSRPTDEDRGARYALEAYHTIEQEKLQLESQIASLLKYDSDQLMVYAAGLDLPDNTIRMLYPEYLKEQRNIESLLSDGHNKNHPTVVAATDRLSKLKEQLDGGVVALRATLQAQNEFVSERLKKLEAVKDASKQEAIKRGLDAHDYVDAKREFETEQERLQLLKLRLIAETISSKNEDKHKERKRPIPTGDEMIAAEEPYSTFSLNISDASYRVAQAALAKGEMPDPEGIKIEQFYNAVDYGDPAPAQGQPVTGTIEQTAHPVIPGRNLVRVAIKTASEGRNQGQPLRLTLLIDQSGSMAREDRRQAMIDALEGLRGLLNENDQVNVIGFSRTARLLAEAVSGKEGQLAKLLNIEANEGGTNLEEALKLGEQLAERHQLEGAQNRMVLFTDGAANLGDADPISLSNKIKELRQKGIAFDIAGIVADGLNDELLGEMARHGNGRYYVVGKGEKNRFAEQLAGAFRPAAENVKVQVHFNSERVGRYKLIGFEKDRLNKEDFHDDTVDAAEMAAEEAGIAIYQIETLPEGKGEIGEVRVRFRDVASGRMIERSWTIANEISTAALDQARPSMQLATLAMMAGEKLRGGPLADAINFNDLGEVIAKVNQHYKGDPKAAEMLEMIDQLK